MNPVSALVFACAIVGLLFARKHWWGWGVSALSYLVWAVQMAMAGDWVYVVMGGLLCGIQTVNMVKARRGRRRVTTEVREGA